MLQGRQRAPQHHCQSPHHCPRHLPVLLLQREWQWQQQQWAEKTWGQAGRGLRRMTLALQMWALRLWRLLEQPRPLQGVVLLLLQKVLLQLSRRWEQPQFRAGGLWGGVLQPWRVRMRPWSFERGWRIPLVSLSPPCPCRHHP